MATYKEIFGKQIKFLSSDPANEAEGQIWYNSTSGTFKSVVASEAWASGAPIATARSAMAGGGIPTAAWIAGGKTNNAPTNTQLLRLKNIMVLVGQPVELYHRDPDHLVKEQVL